MNMNISPVAQRLIQAIDDYKNESCKKEYRYELDEEVILHREIAILEKHLELLEQYEIAKLKEGK